MTFRLEADFQDAFLKELNKHGAWASSIVGGMFSSGKPDIIVCARNGTLRLVELKMWNKVSVPTNDGLRSLLKGPQINVITQQLWAKRQNNCLLLALIAATPEQDKCAYTDYTGKVMLDFWRNTAKLLAEGTLP